MPASPSAAGLGSASAVAAVIDPATTWHATALICSWWPARGDVGNGMNELARSVHRCSGRALARPLVGRLGAEAADLRADQAQRRHPNRHNAPAQDAAGGS